MEKVVSDLINTLKKSEVIVIAVSGGPDSMALLHMLMNLTINPKIIVAHVNHGLRIESENEYLYLKKISLEHKLDFEYYKIEKYETGNFHHQARAERYAFFKKIVLKYNAKYLITAHHGDDLIETMLMKMVRNGNLSNLSGIKQISHLDGIDVYRPMLTTDKVAIMNYCAENSIEFFTDSSNLSDKYLRNRFRNNIIPLMKKENPQLLQTFLNLSNEINDIITFVDNEINYADFIENDKLIITEFKKKDSWMISRIIWYWLSKNYLENINLITNDHIEIIKGMIINPQPNINADLPLNKRISKGYDSIKFVEEVEIYKIPLQIDSVLPNGKKIKEIKDGLKVNDNSNYLTFLSLEQIKMPLFVTNKSSDTKMLVKNSRYSKKINRIFIDEKIELDDRKNQPIVLDSEGTVVWLPGLKKSKFDVGEKGNYDIILKYY